MTIAYLSFTDKGQSLANRIANVVGGEVSRCKQPYSLNDWTSMNFHSCDALVFIGATGIAVRAIAPLVKHKSEDPAVIVIDEGGNFVISLLSGHLGGANELALKISNTIDSCPVITTATDVNHVFAVDTWAKKQGFYIFEKNRIVTISSKVLANDPVFVFIDDDCKIAGSMPKGFVLSDRHDADMIISYHADSHEKALHLIPRDLVLGVGCRRDTEKEPIRELFEEVIKQYHIAKEAFVKIASIDLKKDEKGIHSLKDELQIPFETFTSEQLMSLKGDFTSSDFVKSITGVDNVCERSSVFASKGTVIVPKTAKNGVTIAIAKTSNNFTWN